MQQDTSKDCVITFHSFQNRSDLQTSRDTSRLSQQSHNARICWFGFPNLHLKIRGKKGVCLSGLQIVLDIINAFLHLMASRGSFLHTYVDINVFDLCKNGWREGEVHGTPNYNKTQNSAVCFTFSIAFLFSFPAEFYTRSLLKHHTFRGFIARQCFAKVLSRWRWSSRNLKVVVTEPMQE